MTLAATPEVLVENGVTVIALGPQFENIDERIVNDLREALLEISFKAVSPRIVLDLSNTKFFGSAFIEVLFRLWNRLNTKEGGQFAICGLTPYCAEVLTITHLDTLWRTFPKRDEAVRAIAAAGKA